MAVPTQVEWNAHYSNGDRSTVTVTLRGATNNVQNDDILVVMWSSDDVGSDPAAPTSPTYASAGWVGPTFGSGGGESLSVVFWCKVTTAANVPQTDEFVVGGNRETIGASFVVRGVDSTKIEPFADYASATPKWAINSPTLTYDDNWVASVTGTDGDSPYSVNNLTLTVGSWTEVYQDYISWNVSQWSAVGKITGVDSGTLTAQAIYTTTDSFATATIALPGSTDTGRSGRVSWTEFEVPDAPRRGEVSWAEFEVPDAPRRGEVSWAEFEIPDGAREGRVSWAEFEVPNAPRAGFVSWAELEVPTAPRRGEVSWAEFEVPDTTRAGYVSWAEFEVPDSPRRGEVSWAEFEIPDVPRQGRVSWAEFEIPTAPRSGFVSWAELEIPDAPRRGEISWAELEVPDLNNRSGIVSWAELEVPTAPRIGRVSWAELEIPTPPRRGNISWAEFEIPTAPRAGYVSWAEIEIPTAPRRGFISWAEMSTPDPPRAGRISWTEFQIPNVGGGAPGAGTYSDLDWYGALRARVIFDGNTDDNEGEAKVLSIVLGVPNTGELVGNLQAAGATSVEVPAAVDDLLQDGIERGEQQALRSIAEEYEP